MGPEHLSALVDSLLWEGYALYPYTPTATKNATPTPFGIVYPPAYAATLDSTFDHCELRCVLRAPPDAVLDAEVHFLAASGERHRAGARRLALPGAMAAGLESAARLTATVAAGEGGDQLSVALSLRAEPCGAGEYEAVFRVENRTAAGPGLDRRGALHRSLLSTHPLLRVRGGRFISPLERPCRSVNTFPVLATDADDAVLGAAIVLPDHPRIAAESHGSLFDSTEIEEALLLHVRTLSDEERVAIERDDPAVSAMIARAAAATPSDITALHGRVTVRERRSDRDRRGDRERRDPVTRQPPRPPADLPDPRAGATVADVDGRTFRRGGQVVLRPAPEADLHARLLDGRTATIERIFTDYDGRTHLAVTIDDDPGQELMRETGRYLFFSAPEVEVIDP